MQRLLINILSLYFGFLCFWRSGQASNIWQSDRNLLVKGLGFLDEPIIAFTCGVLTAFALLPKLFNTKTPHSLLLTIIALVLLVFTFFGTLMLSQGKIESFNTSQLHIYYATYVLIFHILTGFLPKIPSWHILQRPLLVLSIPLTLLAILPIQNILIDSVSEQTRNNLAQKFFGFDINETKMLIENCKPFINTYGPVSNIEFKTEYELEFLKRYVKTNALNYTFVNPQGKGIIVTDLVFNTSPVKSYSLQVTTPYQLKIPERIEDTSLNTTPQPMNRVAATGPGGPSFTMTINCP